MKKADRQIVFDKFGGRCAYCGCELTKGWHVDHLEPVIRKKRTVHQHWKHRETGEILEQNEGLRTLRDKADREKWEYVKRREVPDGFQHPERNVLSNMVPACASCNINKHGESVEQFRESIAGYLNSLKTRFVQYKMAHKYGLVQETGKEVKFYFETIQNQGK